jgi:hypothetical protein
MKSILVTIFLLFALISCNYRANMSNQVGDTVHHNKPVSQATIILNNKIIGLLKAGNTRAATRLIDSLIIKNDKDGSLFYIKGFIYSYNEHFEDAILCDKRAEVLGFNKKLCLDDIAHSEQLLHIQTHFRKKDNVSTL